MVDDCDFRAVSQLPLQWDRSRNIVLSGGIRLAHIICERATGVKVVNPFRVIHLDGNSWNLQRANLRRVQRSKGGPKGVKIIRGVRKSGDEWVAELRVHGKKQWIGTYPTRDEAARAHDEAARERFGNRAVLNNV